jgi:Tol biopolymer transport system component
MEQMAKLLLATIWFGAWLCPAACGSGGTSPTGTGGSAASGSGGTAGAAGTNSNGGSVGGSGATWSGSSSGPPPGTGGSQGDGGTPGSGGAVGNGGTTTQQGTGGAPGPGGGVAPGSGGEQGTGGAPGTGGSVTPGTGGQPGSGGSINETGGRAGSGGLTAMGGAMGGASTGSGGGAGLTGSGGLGAGGAGGTAAGGSGSASWNPLPATTLVFAKRVRSSADYLYAYDTATNTATLISVLDDNGSIGTIVRGIALSPDHKWIAFAAAFRLSTSDVGASARTSDAIWLVSVDGSTYSRLTPTPTFTNTNTTPCSADAACTALGMTCDVTYQQCRYMNFTMTLQNPSWSPSGDTVWFDYQETWWSLGGTEEGGGQMVNVSSTGGKPNIVVGDGSCQIMVGPSLDPTGTKVAAERSLCTNEANGLVLFDIASKQTSLLVGMTVYEAPVFSHDGSVIAFVAKSSSTPYEDLYLYSVDTGQTIDLFQGTSDLKTWEIAFSPDNDHFVLGVAGDLYLSQASDLTSTPKQLTTDGNNRFPSW